MKFWPLSEIVASPAMPPCFVHELRNFYRRMPSEGAYHAAKAVAQHTKAVQAPNLVIIETLAGPSRRVYIDYPDEPEWLHLERATVMEHDGYTFILLDALH